MTVAKSSTSPVGFQMSHAWDGLCTLLRPAPHPESISERRASPQMGRSQLRALPIPWPIHPHGGHHLVLSQQGGMLGS